MKSVRIRSYSGRHFPAFGLNTETYSVSLRIQSECEKMGTRITPNTDTFLAVIAYAIQKTIPRNLNYFHCLNIIAPMEKAHFMAPMEYTLSVYSLNEKRHGFMKDCFSKCNDYGKRQKNTS